MTRSRPLRRERRQLISSPVEAFRDTPVTTGMHLLLTLYVFWLSWVLITVTSHFPPIKLLGYHGPMSIMDIRHWGWWFFIAGCAGTLRLFFHKAPRMGLLMHLVKMSVILAWAVAFDIGPATTGQPAYTFVALVSFGTQFAAPMIERRYGIARPPLQPRNRSGNR